MVNELVVMRI